MDKDRVESSSSGGHVTSCSSRVVVLLQLLGLGSALLENVDPNPENYVCAGVIQTKGQQVGCLLRLEPNAQAQVPRRRHHSAQSGPVGVLGPGWTAGSGAARPTAPTVSPRPLAWVPDFQTLKSLRWSAGESLENLSRTSVSGGTVEVES